MPGQYSLRSLFRSVPRTLLQRHLAGREQFASLDWDRLDELDVEPLVDAWDQLPEAERNQGDADFRDIWSLADELGTGAIFQEAQFHGEDLTDSFASLDDSIDRAFWTFLERPQYFEVALRHVEAERLPARSWQRCYGLPPSRPDTSEETKTFLESALSQYYRRREGRGRTCKVEIYKWQGRYYYFAFLEDYARAEESFESGTMSRSAHRPAFQVVFAFDPANGTLDTYGMGGRRVVQDLQEQFAVVVLKSELPEPTADQRVYDLEPLRRRDFTFTYPFESGIESVILTRLRLSFRYQPGKRVVLEGRSTSIIADLYEEIVQVSPTGRGISASLLAATQAELKVTYRAVGSKRPNAKTIRITFPNNCSLGTDARDDVLRTMLIESGIDPHALGLDRRR